MPEIERFAGWLISFYSMEESRPHIHIDHKDGRSMKIWLQPEVSLANNYGVNQKTLRKMLKRAEEKQVEYLEEWHAHFDT